MESLIVSRYYSHVEKLGWHSRYAALPPGESGAVSSTFQEDPC